MTGLSFGALAKMSRLKEKAHAAFCYIHVTDVCIHGNMSARGTFTLLLRRRGRLCLFHITVHAWPTFTLCLYSLIVLKFLQQTFVTFVCKKI